MKTHKRLRYIPLTIATAGLIIAVSFQQLPEIIIGVTIWIMMLVWTIKMWK